jgi:hypothetical protein
MLPPASHVAGPHDPRLAAVRLGDVQGDVWARDIGTSGG